MSLEFEVLPKGQHRVVKRTVKFTYTTAKNNTVQMGFEAHFKLLPEDELNKVMTVEGEADDGPMANSMLLAAMVAKDGHKRLMNEVWVDCEGLVQKNKAGEKEPLKFSDQVRDGLLQDLAVREAVVAEYFNALNGRKPKN